MAYDDIEASVQDAELIELYKFTEKETGLVWAFTSATDVITYDGDAYTPEGITREKVGAEAAEPFKAQMKITTARSNSFAIRFISGIVDSEISIEIFKRYLPTEDQITFWSGEVSLVKIGSTKADITCVPVNLDLPRKLLHQKYQKQCAHALYSEHGCKVVEALYSVAGTLTVIDGADYSATEFSTKPDDYFTGGYLQVGSEKKMIAAHTGDTVTLLTPMVSALVSHSCTAHAGCLHNQSDCVDKFNNILNYGGQPYIPDKNVFDGDGISY